MITSDYREAARRALAGNWPMAVLTGLVATLLGGMSIGTNFEWRTERHLETLQRISPRMAMLLLGLIGVIGVLAFAYGLVQLVLGSVVELGYARYNLNLVDGKTAQLGDLFGAFGQIWNALVLRVLTGLFIFLWSLLLVIPGLVAAYSYSAAPYIMAEDPDCTPMEALRRSKARMDGHKMSLFLLDLSFIGWYLLSALTLGIGNLFLTPYTHAARAAFYRSLPAQAAEASASGWDNGWEQQ